MKPKRERLTITMKEDLLSLIDDVIDGDRIRNRSHAIEYILSQTLQPKVKKAFILAGGKGLRMRPFTYEIPKTLIPIHGKPLLEYTIETLKDNGFRDIYILIGHLGEKIEAHFGDGSNFGVRITYIREFKENGTAAPLRQAKKYFQNSDFLMIYGDTLFEINLKEMVEFHKMNNGLMTMAVTSSDKPHEFGVVSLSGNKVESFKEKPGKQKGISHFINSGIFIMNSKIIDYIPTKGYSMIEKDIIPKLVKEGKLFAYPFAGHWYDIGTPKIYEEVLKEWKKN